MVDRVLLWASSADLNGTLRVLPGTPLEGQAQFSKGQLQGAQFCFLEGRAALEAILGMGDAELKFETAATCSSTPFTAAVLVVDDDATMRTMLARRLEKEGYRVRAAADGLEALGIVAHQMFDVVVTDLDMPRLDGWGLLSCLRTSVATREIHVVLLSAVEDAVMTLKAARAGAHAYLLKTGRARELSAALALLTGPRRSTWEALHGSRDCSLSLAGVGTGWLLDVLSVMEATGRLEMEDELGRYELVLSRAHLLDATAQKGSFRAKGDVALEAMFGCRGHGRFVFDASVRATGVEPWLSAQLQAVRYRLTQRAAHRLEDIVPKDLRINEALAALYGRSATARELHLLDALRSLPGTMEDLAANAGLSLRDTTRIVTGLLRHGVLQLRKG